VEGIRAGVERRRRLKAEKAAIENEEPLDVASARPRVRSSKFVRMVNPQLTLEEEAAWKKSIRQKPRPYIPRPLVNGKKRARGLSKTTLAKMAEAALLPPEEVPAKRGSGRPRTKPFGPKPFDPRRASV
jgi:hypothetical protein